MQTKDAENKIDLEKKLHYLRQEVLRKEKAFPNLIAKGKLPEKVADREMQILKAILADYETKI